MPSNDTIGSNTAANNSDWNNAWEVVSRLAAARETAQHEIGANQQGTAILESASVPRGASAAAAIAAKPVVDPDQLARAVAEIEKAAAALRRSEPALEVWLPQSAPGREKRKYRSVWILIGGIWLSATLVVAGATGAIFYLFG